MFGYIMADRKALGPEDRARYGKWYCGLCHILSERFGATGSATLTYDMTFLCLLLSAVYDLPEDSGSERCAVKPVKAHQYIISEATGYAADMNLFLAYYQCLDDWHDDQNLVQHKRSQRMERYLPDIRKRHQRPTAAIEGALQTLGEMERDNELNPDLPANCFGHLMGELFAWREDEHANTLRRMGAALGRFVYLLDAVNDLRDDLKKQRYNPLIAQLHTDFTPILTMMMGECAKAFDALPVSRDRDIIHNVLYSGVWQKYLMRPTKETEA